jgi:hypothetical protein
MLVRMRVEMPDKHSSRWFLQLLTGEARFRLLLPEVVNPYSGICKTPLPYHPAISIARQQQALLKLVPC